MQVDVHVDLDSCCKGTIFMTEDLNCSTSTVFLNPCIASPQIVPIEMFLLLVE